MARNTRLRADPTRKAAFASGVFYLITFASSIPAYLLLEPILTNPAYILGAGADQQVLVACLLDLVNALACIGSAVAVFSVIKRQHEGLALGFISTRMFEAATIVVGIVSLLAVVSIRQAGPAAGADTGSLVAVGQGLVAVRDWTFILGPSLMPGFNALMFATVLYRSRLVPRLIPAMGLVGAPLLITSATGMILGLNELGSAFSAIATAPIFFWELSVGLWMTFKGFNRHAPVIASGSTDDGEASDIAPSTTAMGAAVASGVAMAVASVTAPVRRLRPRHLLVIVGLALAFAANAETQSRGFGLVPVIAFAIAPRLPLLLGLGQPKAPGRMARRAVPLFNALHEPALPVAIIALSLVGILPALWLVGGLAWLGQLVIDWALGDGIRESDGSLRSAPSRWSSWPARVWPAARSIAS
jgi:Domain of unknown function (DUF4386)